MVLRGVVCVGGEEGTAVEGEGLLADGVGVADVAVEDLVQGEARPQQGFVCGGRGGGCSVGPSSSRGKLCWTEGGDTSSKGYFLPAAISSMIFPARIGTCIQSITRKFQTSGHLPGTHPRRGGASEASDAMGAVNLLPDPPECEVFGKGTDRAADSVLHLDDVLVDVVHVHNLGGGRGTRHDPGRPAGECSTILASNGCCGTEDLHVAVARNLSGCDVPPNFVYTQTLPGQKRGEVTGYLPRDLLTQ